MLTAVDLLELWESGLGRRPVERAVSVLQRALSEDKEEVERLPIGRRDRLLLDLRERLFGSHMTAVTECGACAARIELEFEAEEIRASSATDSATGSATESDGLNVTCEGYEVQLRLPDSRDVMQGIGLAPDAAVEELFARCVLQARKGEELVSARELPPAVVECVTESLAAADPQADTRLAVQCPECGRMNRPSFDIGTYLWHEMEAFALRLLRDAHELARAYGWAEGQILAMSATRRRCYLEMVRA